MRMTRCLRQISVVLLSMLFIVCSLIATCPEAVRAESSPLVGVALTLLDNAIPVEMTGLAVDIRMRSADGHTYADVSCQFHLHNRDRLAAYEVPMGFPRQAVGDSTFDPTSLPALRLTVDGSSVAPTPDGSYAAWTQSFARDAKVVVEMDYVVDLGDDLITTARYDPTPAAEWATRVDGVRITFHLPKSTTSEQILSMQPSTLTFDGQVIAWMAEYAEPDSPLVVRVISPPVWDEISAARETVSANPRSAKDHYRLASLYMQLDPPVASDDAPDLYASTLAHLLEVEELDPGFVPAYLDTARLYQAQAHRHPAMAPHYLALAAEQLSAALAFLPGDTDLRGDLAETYLQLAATSRDHREYDLAWFYFEKSAESAPEDRKAEYDARIQQEIQITSMAWTASLLEEGRAEEAIELARQRLGVDLIEGYRGHKPLLALLRGNVRTDEHERKIRFVLTPYVVEGSPELEQHLGGVVTGLSATGAASVTLTHDANQYTLDVTIPFADTEDLLYRIGLLEATLPFDLDPSLGMLRAVLQPRALAFHHQETLVGLDVEYFEEVDLHESAAALLEAQERARWALMELEAQNPQDEQGKALRRLALGLLREYERVWGRQVKEDRLHYQVSVTSASGDSQSREWDLDLGGAVTGDLVSSLSWNGRIYDRRATIRFAATVLASLGLLAWLFALLRSRRRVK